MTWLVTTLVNDLNRPGQVYLCTIFHVIRLLRFDQFCRSVAWLFATSELLITLSKPTSQQLDLVQSDCNCITQSFSFWPFRYNYHLLASKWLFWLILIVLKLDSFCKCVTTLGAFSCLPLIFFTGICTSLRYQVMADSPIND